MRVSQTFIVINSVRVSRLLFKLNFAKPRMRWPNNPFASPFNVVNTPQQSAVARMFDHTKILLQFSTKMKISYGLMNKLEVCCSEWHGRPLGGVEGEFALRLCAFAGDSSVFAGGIGRQELVSRKGAKPQGRKFTVKNLTQSATNSFRQGI